MCYNEVYISLIEQTYLKISQIRHQHLYMLNNFLDVIERVIADIQGNHLRKVTAFYLMILLLWEQDFHLIRREIQQLELLELFEEV